MTNQQGAPDALRLADEFKLCNEYDSIPSINDIAEECLDAARSLRASIQRPHFGDEAHVAIPQMLLCAACSAIDKKRDGTKVLAELRRYTTGDLSQAIAPAPVREEREAFKAAHRHLELDEVPDAWGRPTFKHSHVEASWLGWIARASRAPAGSVLEDAARYRYLRDGDWREHEKLESVIRLQLNTLWDETIDAARAAQEGK